MMLLYTYQIFSSLWGHLHFCVYFFFFFTGYFFWSTPYRYSPTDSRFVYIRNRFGVLAKKFVVPCLKEKMIEKLTKILFRLAGQLFCSCNFMSIFRDHSRHVSRESWHMGGIWRKSASKFLIGRRKIWVFSSMRSSKIDDQNLLPFFLNPAANY